MDKNLFDIIDVEVAVNSAAKQPEFEPVNSFLCVERMNRFVSDGLLMDKPEELFPNIMVKHETSILFGDTGLGKSTLAAQMAILLATKGEVVFYVNFELSKQQFAQKYPGKDIPDNVYMVTVDYAKMHDVTDQSFILGEIERLAVECQATVVIVDNFTNLCMNSKEGSEAGNIMLKLLSLRMTHDWTMLVLAHVPKRKAADPLTLNDLAGSKILSNLADNVVGINKSKLGSNKRYLIQLKYRSMPIRLDSQNVQELTMTTEGGYLHFEFGGFDEERVHLPRSRDEKAELERDIVNELKQFNGKTYREIAAKLGTNLSMVHRVASQYGLNRKSNN